MRIKVELDLSFEQWINLMNDLRESGIEILGALVSSKDEGEKNKA